MLVHRLLVESVDLRGLGGSSGGNDLLGERFDRCPESPGEKELGALRRKGARDSAADRASGSVDHRNLVLEHHLAFPSDSLAAELPLCQEGDGGARKSIALARTRPRPGARSS